MSAAGGSADLQAIATNPDAYNDLVYSTVNTVDADGNVVSGYGWKAGTSMAAPQVAGAVALVRSLDPDARSRRSNSSSATPPPRRMKANSTTVRATSTSKRL